VRCSAIRLGLLRPAQDRHAGELGPVVGNAAQRTATRRDHEVELASDAAPGERGIGHQAQALAGEVVDHRQDTEAAAVGECVADEVERPALVRPLRQSNRRPCAKGALTAAAAADVKPLLGIEPPQPLVVHVRAVAFKQDMQAPIAKPLARRCQLAQLEPDRRVIRPPTAIADRCSIRSDHLARPPLAHRIGLAQVSRGYSSGDGRHHFFEAMSFNMALSSIASASSFFSFPFSSSSVFSRRASDTSSPPYFAFHL
jgi:hypothetical protein